MLALILSPIGRVIGGLLMLVALFGGVMAWGSSKYRAGAAEERAKWEAAAQAERQRQASIKTAVEELGEKVAADIGARLAGIESRQKELIDAAKDEDAKPVPDACRDVYRGLPPSVLRGIEAVR